MDLRRIQNGECNLEKPPYIIIASTLEDISKLSFDGYLAHAFCYDGSCTFQFNGNKYTMVAGDCMVIRRGDLISELNISTNFRIDVIYVTKEFIEISTPQSNYGMKGQLSLFNNPIMRLTPEQQKVCTLDFNYIKRRWALTDHYFHRDAMINAIQCMIIDLFDFHAHLYGNEKITSQYFLIMEQFQNLLERGDYRKNRNIDYYAEKLCITSKYLSEVSKIVSGFPANYWINRYTILDISRELRDRNKTLSELVHLYGFSSSSYFTQYVRKHLGTTPKDFRE